MSYRIYSIIARFLLDIRRQVIMAVPAESTLYLCTVSLTLVSFDHFDNKVNRVIESQLEASPATDHYQIVGRS